MSMHTSAWWQHSSQLMRHTTGWLPTRIPLRLRFFFRITFLLLALATLGLAFSILIAEQQRGFKAYRDGFAKTLAQLSTRLRHPTGQLALLNPGMVSLTDTKKGLAPVVLPFFAIDFDDRAKVQQAVEMAGCSVHYDLEALGQPGREAQLCVAIGHNPLAGGFIYAVGSVPSTELIPRAWGERDFRTAHRLRVALEMRGQTWHWIAPFEVPNDGAVLPTMTQKGRLTGFAEEADGRIREKPIRDFRGWLWRDARCLPSMAPVPESDGDCLRQAFFSVRLPVELFQLELYKRRGDVVWPPPDLQDIRLRVQLLPPGDPQQLPLFDSTQAIANAPFTLDALQDQLLPGETLTIKRLPHTTIANLRGHERETPVSLWSDTLIEQLPLGQRLSSLQAQDTIVTPLGDYELTLTGDARSVNRQLSIVAERVAWFVGAMLLAVLLSWLALELRIIRRITLLTQRAALVSKGVRENQGGEIRLNVSDLRGRDELGLLAGTLDDLMQRVNDDVRREYIRVQQEKDQWHAVGHEIVSPLQSLLVLHPNPEDPSHRYIHRMQQAIKVLYGQASPSEAFAATTLPVQTLDLWAFLQEISENAPHADIPAVVLEIARDTPRPLWVRGDAYALEDVVTHVLKNAHRFRIPNTHIRLHLSLVTSNGVEHAQIAIANQGHAIPNDQLERIFEYGVSNQATPHDSPNPTSHRGQGLFVARTYMAKMGGTITAENTSDGVQFVLSMQRLTG